MRVVLDLYGVVLDSARMRAGYRERLVDLLQGRFGGDRAAWAKAHDEAYETYVDRAEKETDWNARPWAEIAGRLDADLYGMILERAGASWRPEDPLGFARSTEFELMSTVDARFPDARPAIERLRRDGHRVYIATGATDANGRGALTGAGLIDTVDGVFTGTTQNAAKSQLAYWTSVAGRLGGASGICVVDDRVEYLEPAADAGFTVLLLDRSGCASPSVPSFVRATLRNLAGLPEYVRVLESERGP